MIEKCACLSGQALSEFLDLGSHERVLSGTEPQWQPNFGMGTRVMRSIGALLAAATISTAMAAPAWADSYWEVEHARANARAGGPVSERDAELLERYGCLSGTKNSFCERLASGDRKAYRAERKRVRRD